MSYIRLRFGAVSDAQGACRAFTDSLVGLGSNDLTRVGRDPSGSRALEAVLAGGAPAKVTH